ncbi:DNA-directed RNA polymerase I subunit rpa49, partial [Tulasnella sp. 424]
MSNFDSKQPRKGNPKVSMAKSRATVRENTKSIAVRLLNEPECPGPLLASTSCTDVLEGSEFFLYAQEAVLQKGWPVTKMPHFLRGSTNAVEYLSRENDVKADSGHASQFVVGVYDRNINAVTLYHTAAHTIDCSAIGPNVLNAATSANSVGLGYHATRAALGHAFGNAKAKRGIEDVAKRTIDPRAVSLTITAVQESIDTATGILPDDELPLNARSPPLIPPVNHSAATVDEVYPLQNIVSTAELSSLDVDDLLSARLESRTASLPVRSRWVTYMISRIGPNPPTQD